MIWLISGRRWWSHLPTLRLTGCIIEMIGNVWKPGNRGKHRHMIAWSFLVFLPWIVRKSGIFFIKPGTLTRCRLRYNVRKLLYFAQTWPFATDAWQGRRVQSLPSMRAESDSDSEGIGGSWRMRLMQSSDVMTFKWQSEFQLGAFTFCQSMILRVFNVIALNRLFAFVWVVLFFEDVRNLFRVWLCLPSPGLPSPQSSESWQIRPLQSSAQWTTSKRLKRLRVERRNVLKPLVHINNINRFSV